MFPYTALTRNIPTVSPPTTPPPRVSCGVKKVNRSSFGGLGIGQIVGGKISSPGAWPWQAAIMCKTCQAQDCGGTLVSAYHVVTSAHCVPTNNETFIKKYKVSDVSTNLDDRGVSLSNATATRLHESTQENFGTQGATIQLLHTLACCSAWIWRFTIRYNFSKRSYSDLQS